MTDQERKKRNRANRQRGKAFERRIAKLLGGRRVPYSGAGGDRYGGKRDVTVELVPPGTESFKSVNPSIQFKIECKAVSPKKKGGNFTVLRGELESVTREERQWVQDPDKERIIQDIGLYIFSEKGNSDAYAIMHIDDLRRIIQEHLRLVPRNPAYGDPPPIPKV